MVYVPLMIGANWDLGLDLEGDRIKEAVTELVGNLVGVAIGKYVDIFVGQYVKNFVGYIDDEYSRGESVGESLNIAVGNCEGSSEDW